MGETTLRQALEDYKNIYMPYRNFAERTRVEYQNDLEGFVQFLEDAGVQYVTGPRLSLIQRFAARLEQKGFASITRKRKVVAIRSFLQFLYQNRYITTNIASSVIVPFVENTTPHILTQSEIGRLVTSSVDNPRDFAMIELLLQTGIRLSELVDLAIDDIEIRVSTPGGERWTGSIRVRASRGTRERIIALNTSACLALRHYLHSTATERGSLFLNRLGYALGERGVQKILRNYFRKAGINGARVHTLRHTFAVRQLAQGTKLEDLQKMMGHKDKRSTSIYAAYIVQLKKPESRVPS